MLIFVSEGHIINLDQVSEIVFNFDNYRNRNTLVYFIGSDRNPTILSMEEGTTLFRAIKQGAQPHA